MTITPELLLRGYSMGIFPMAEHQSDPEIFWVDPRRRGIMPLNGFHLSRSLAQRMRRGGYHVAINEDFAGTVRACADRSETWINDEIFGLYLALHQMGHAHSFEIHNDTGLIGGVYGVVLGSAFFGESMFSRARDGSKLALVHLIDHLSRAGFTLFDTQFLMDHLASLGAIEIPRAAYHLRLEMALERRTNLVETPLETDPYFVIQRVTQTS